MRTEEQRLRISQATKEAMYRPDVQEKIRAKRSNLSVEHKNNISKSLKGKMPKFIPDNTGDKNGMYGKPWTDERKAWQSDKLKGKMPKNMAFGGNGAYANVKRGEYECSKGSVYFRSKWEANYSIFLDFLVKQGEIIKWEYEPDTFVFEAIKFGTRSYTPDFKVFNNNGGFTYHEVKGYMDQRSKTKLKRMKKYFPDVKVVLIEKAFYQDMMKKMGKLITFY